MGEASICFDDSMTIPWDECMALAALYSATSGSGRSNKNNRLEVGDVDTWFGINVTEPQADGNRHVSEILLHRSDTTSTSDGLYEGNNLIGTIPSEIAQLTYLTTLRL